MPEPTVLDAPELKHFLKLARAGHFDKEYSPAETAAGELAWSVKHFAKDLDETAIRGLVMFIGLAKTCPDKARELLEIQ